MGQWGSQTFEGDSVMDFLQKYPDDGVLSKMTQAMADDTLDDVWKSGTNFDRLGVVVWLLIQEFIVPRDILVSALKYANAELHPDVLDNWKEKEERKEELVIEMNEIRFAMKNGGKGRKRKQKPVNEERTIKLSCYGIVVNLPSDGGGAAITSDMHETCPYCNDPACNMDCPDFQEHCSDRDKDEQIQKANERYEFLAHRAAVDTLESFIMACACSGLDIESSAFLEAIETTNQALMNADFSVE